MVATMPAFGVGFTAHAAETRAANPSQLEGRKEVALVDTSVKDYQDLARGIGAGIGIVEFDGSKDGLAQIAQWAATARGYDAIHILSHGSAGVVRLGTAVLTQESLADATTQAELSALGRALVTGGDVLLYSCDVASGISDRAFVKSLSATMGVDVAASSDATGDAAQGGNWVLEYQTGAIETAKLTVRGYPHLLASTTFDFESVTPGSNSKTITQTIGSDTMVITSTDSNMLVDSESNAFGFDVPDASGNVMATGEGGFYTESRLVLTMSGGKTFDLTSFTLAQVGFDGATITLTTSKGSETFTANFVGNSWVLNLSTAVHPGYFVGVSSVVITTADSGGVFEWGFDNIVLSNIVGPPSTIVVTAALSQDSGQSSSDFITNVAAQTISGTLSANLLAGESVQVSFDNGSTWSNATSAVGSSTWSTNATLAGSNTFQARVANANGSSAAYTHTYTLDTTAPSITFSNLGLSADTGLSATDFITNAASQTISATLSSTLALGDVVYGSLDGGATWFDVSSKVSGTTLAWSGATLVNGSNNLRFWVTDAAGNIGPVTNQSYTLDTTAPTTIIANASFSNDNGFSTSDFITNIAFQTVSGTLSANLAAGETVYVSLNNGATWTAANAAVGSNNWSLTGVTLSSSSTLKIKLTDTAGNDGTVYAQAYVYDTTAPATTFSNLTLSSDTGASSSDFITSAASQTLAATLSTALSVGDTVWGSLDGGGTWANVTSSVTGTVLTWSGITLLPGGNTLQLKVVDMAGNSGAVKSQAYVLDTTAPAAPSTPVLSNDSGASSNDGITNVVTPQLTGTAEPGSTVNVYDGAALLGSITATGGAWSFTAGALAEGPHTITARATDLAGNVSPASNALVVTIDTTAPAVTSVAPPPNATYYAGDSLDFTVNFNESVHVDTSGGTPRIAIVVGATTRYATYVSGSGTSALVFRHTVVNGDVDANGITVGALNANGSTLSDLAGHNAVLTLNGLGSTAGVLVDGSQPSITSVSSSNANGSYGAGQAISITVGFSSAVVVDTSGGTPTLALNSGGTAAYASGSGTSTLTFSYTVAAGHNSADLDYSSTGALALNGATIKDSGGIHVNALLQLSAPGAAGSLGANKNIVIDTTAPTTTVATAAFSADTGASSTDLITKVAAQTVSGTLSANLASGETVQVSLDNGATWATATASVGSSAWSLSGVTLTGSNTLKARVSDAASNSGAVWSSAYVLDTTAPTVPTVNALVATSTTPTLTGTATLAAGETLTVSVGGATYAVVPTGGNWSLNLASATPASGTLALTYSSTHSVTATATDLAGNASTDTTTNELVIGAAPTAPAAPSFTSVTAGDRSVSLVWSAPASNGSPITGYQVTGTPSGSCSTTGATSCTVTGLTNGTSYTFTMTATNSVGTSAPSAAPSAVIPRLLTVSGSAPDMPGTATATLSGGGASCTLDPTSGFASLSNPAPAGKTMLYGEYAFQASGCTASVTMTLEYPQPLPQGVQFWKYGPATVGATSSTWFPLAGVTLSVDRKTVSYTITDNGVGDSDPVAGAIRDPFALVAGPVVSDPASIPVDAPWALGLLSAALGALGWRRQRRLARRC